MQEMLLDEDTTLNVFNVININNIRHRCDKDNKTYSLVTLVSKQSKWELTYLVQSVGLKEGFEKLRNKKKKKSNDQFIKINTKRRTNETKAADLNKVLECF